MYSFLVDNNEHKKQKAWVKMLKKDHRTEIYEIKQTLLSWFHDKIYIQNNGYDGLALDYQS